MNDSASMWWKELPAAKQLIQRITEILINGQQVIFHIPVDTPWKDVMHEALADCLQEHSLGQKSLKIISAQDIGDDKDAFGKYLMENFCKADLRYKYRPSLGYAKFLADSQGSTIKDYWIFVYDVSESQVKNWTAFLQEYNAASGGLPDCICLFETTSKLSISYKGMQCIDYQQKITPYDCFIFYLLLISDSAVQQDYREYLSELVIQIAGYDIELGANCIQYGKQFLEQPGEVLKQIVETTYRSDGSEFASLSVEKVEQAIWSAQLKQIFPRIETYRHKFLLNHRKEVEANLPQENSYHELVEDISDVEIGMLHFFMTHNKIVLNYEEQQTLQLFYEARNVLAHMKYLSFDKIREILLQS